MFPFFSWTSTINFKLTNELRTSLNQGNLKEYNAPCFSHIPAPVIFEPLKDVLPVASAPSRLALLKFA